MLFLTAFCLFTVNAFANNYTVTGAFYGTEALMDDNPESCDAGYLPLGDIADSVIMIYSGSFDSANPAGNRVASVDEAGDVQLDAVTSYTLVVQHWCEEVNGVYAIVIEGQGTVSGDVFTSPAQTIGNFDGGSPNAYFADLDATVRYRADEKTVDESGIYYFVDIGEETGGSYMVIRICENSFNPQDTEANLVYNSNVDSTDFFIGSFTL